MKIRSMLIFPMGKKLFFLMSFSLWLGCVPNDWYTESVIYSNFLFSNPFRLYVSNVEKETLANELKIIQKNIQILHLDNTRTQVKQESSVFLDERRYQIDLYHQKKYTLLRIRYNDVLLFQDRLLYLTHWFNLGNPNKSQDLLQGFPLNNNWSLYLIDLKGPFNKDTSSELILLNKEDLHNIGFREGAPLRYQLIFVHKKAKQLLSRYYWPRQKFSLIQN